VFEEPVPVSEGQLYLLRKLLDYKDKKMGGNYRPPQNISGRTVLITRQDYKP